MPSNDMGTKIHTLREKLGLTLEQVGNAVGVGKSTVRKWETGMIANMRRDKIADLAKVLHTTPAYLMGWPEEDKSINEVFPTSEKEKKLVIAYRSHPEMQTAIDKLLGIDDTYSTEKESKNA